MRARSIAISIGLLFAALAVVAYFVLPDYRNAIEEQRSKAGIVVTDRNNRILRLIPDSRDRFNIWYETANMPESLKLCVIAAEDHRFRYHLGFDPIAVARAPAARDPSGRTP